MNTSPQDTCCAHEHSSLPKPWWKKPLWWLAVLIAFSFVLPIPGDTILSFRESLIHYFEMILWPVGLGLLLGGVIDHFIPSEYIAKHLASTQKRTIFYSVSLGFLMSACSHGILALSMQLHKKGASHASVISFLLASPWANLPVTFLLVSFFGGKGFLIIVSSLIIALITGFIFQKLDQAHWIEKSKHAVVMEENFSIRKDLLKRMKAYRFTSAQLIGDLKGILKGALGLADMVLFWLLLGVVMASLASVFVPHQVFHHYFGASLTGLAMTMIVATVMEVCSEGTAPVAFEIYKQTGAFGNAFAFLMGGVVTDYTEIGLVASNLGKKTAFWMVAVALPQVILLAWIFNSIF